MNMYTHIHVYVYVSVFLYIDIYIYVYVCIGMYVYLYIYIHICICVNHACANVDVGSSSAFNVRPALLLEWLELPSQAAADSSSGKRVTKR
jgi:hypothetical protein